ncbi:MAG: efflux RND transporter periplasmic adaptor subunit [Pirellulales bacterium]|nr:efflux RND transporter periplasmic adaptor subunit [Pirellulales bacterium]
MRTAIALILIVSIAAGGAAYYVKHSGNDDAASFRTVPIQRGDLMRTIRASGTMQAEELVDVGSQITGKILNFGPDLDNPGKTIDFNSRVRKDQLLANIDPTYYQAKVDQCRAALMKAQAELKQLEAICRQKENEWERAKELMPKNAIAGSDYDAAEADYLVAQANIAVGNSAVKQAEAALRMAEIDLNYTRIISPVDGIVVKRRVNVGQTVTAGLNTPSMFLIAKDLRRMEVWVPVNEADIGNIRLDMPVGFVAAGFPEDTYRGVVSQIRMDASMTQNVITYVVVVTTENPDLKLLPYMTADLVFEVAERRDVLLVPNAALQWRPKQSQIAPQYREVRSNSHAAENTPSGKEEANGSMQRIWLADGAFVRPLNVAVGITDEVNSEIGGEGVKEGMDVVIGIEQAGSGVEEDDSAGTSIPFLPKPPKGNRRPPPPD